MPIVRTTRGAFYTVGTGPEIEIPGVIFISFRLVRDFEVQDLVTPSIPKGRSVFGQIGLTDLDVALALFDVTPVGGVLPERRLDLIARYVEGNVNKKKTFKDAMTGVGRGDELSTFVPMVDDGKIVLQTISFTLRMPPGDSVSAHILTVDE